MDYNLSCKLTEWVYCTEVCSVLVQLHNQSEKCKRGSQQAATSALCTILSYAKIVWAIIYKELRFPAASRHLGLRLRRLELQQRIFQKMNFLHQSWIKPRFFTCRGYNEVATWKFRSESGPGDYAMTTGQNSGYCSKFAQIPGFA
ncbi:hypothetical protein ACJJTC_003546 [Scirpophaga incertulas]